MVQLLVARKTWLREQSTATGSDTVLTNVWPLKMLKLEFGNTLTILQAVGHFIHGTCSVYTSRRVTNRHWQPFCKIKWPPTVLLQ